MINKMFCVIIFGLLSPVFLQAQDVEQSRLATILYGTETEIAALVQSLRTEGADYLDDELITLVDTTRNQRILSGVFSFFGDREKSGLEERAIRVIEERDDEANETVHSAIDYIGKVKASDAVGALMELLDSGERRFMNGAFRALGRVGIADAETADDVAEYLIDYYSYRDPGDDNRREVITSIGATGSSRGVSLLVELVSDNDERIPLRIAALDALSKIGDPDGLEAILGCINSNDPNVRSAAVGALGPFSGEDVDNAILDAFRDSYYRTRIAACHASRDRRLAIAVPYLQFRAERDDVPNVKDEAIRALGAIANEEALAAIDVFFTQRRNSDRVRLVSAEMLMKNSGGVYFPRLAAELDDARQRNQTALYNGFLKIAGETIIAGREEQASSIMLNVTRRFLQTGGIMEKLYGLDMAANNDLKELAEEIITLTKERNESLARRAQRTAERLGIEL
ncbi:MAG: HEAT repeat domain-containing protein [Treponema sp.]|nr:HEAT repeat domain-containing protein [Treponema sp.]